eukprot:scpid73569/ scgid21785/ 
MQTILISGSGPITQATGAPHKSHITTLGAGSGGGPITQRIASSGSGPLSPAGAVTIDSKADHAGTSITPADRKSGSAPSQHGSYGVSATSTSESASSTGRAKRNYTNGRSSVVSANKRARSSWAAWSEPRC